MPSTPPLSPETLPLRDIHLPDPVSWWPLPLGWWLLLGLIILLLAGLWWFGCRYRRGRFRRLALRELEAIAQGDGGDQAAALSRLLRRAALCYFPPEECAGLCGEEWLVFLDRPFADAPFSQGVGRTLIEAPYRPAAELDAPAFLALCRRWLEKLPVHRHRKGRKQ